MLMMEGGASAEEALLRSWRTSLLTLRDEATTLHSPPALLKLLKHLILSPSSNSNSTSEEEEGLLSVLMDLSTAQLQKLIPSHELSSDLIFLFDLAADSASAGEHDDDVAHTFAQLLQFMHNIQNRVSFHINSSYWVQLLSSFERMVTFLLRSCRKRTSSENVAFKAIKHSLEIIRSLAIVQHRNCSLVETPGLLKFLLSIAACSHDELFCSSSSNGYQTCTADFGKSMARHNSLLEIRSAVFTMIGDVFSRAGSSLSADIWQSTIEVLKKDMDTLASSGVLVQDSIVARFHTSLLNCLHLVLVDPKGPLANHVAGLVAALRMFFSYGTSDRSQLLDPSASFQKKSYSAGPNYMIGSNKSESGRYRPPHLRKQIASDQQPKKSLISSSGSDQEPCANFTSSDSDCSDSDGPTIGAHNIHCCKARVAAIVCIQDLCRVDPKLFTAQWTMLLPATDVLQPRRYEATLMTSLLFDPYFKARIASASTLISMLDGPASVFLQVAEYKDSVKRGSFTSLSSSLGQILLQLHTGILFLIQHETHGGLLPSIFKILMLLISSTPYSRMPDDLLPTLIMSLQAKVKAGFPQRSDQSSLLAIVINSLTAAISTSPSSPKVREMFRQEISQGNFVDKEKFSVLSSIIQYSESVNNPTLNLEALQALRAVSHNYPDIIGFCWTHVSSTIHGILRANSSASSSWRRNPGSVGEKVITAAVKVLDECLRAISGFKGTEDIFDDKTFDTPFTSEYTRTKKVSSAPSHGSESSREATKNESESCILAIQPWSEALEKHLPLVLSHTSSMVRSASVTCFAGLTSSVFSTLTNQKQHLVLSFTINAALRDDVPSVRSAACRAIGVITCFPLISESAEMLGKFTHAVEKNSRDSLILVRIAASWALANICDSLRHLTNAATSESCSIDRNESSRLIALTLESALEMTKDNDKIKANAVRALGNLSRFVNFTSQSGLPIETEDNKEFPAKSSKSKDVTFGNSCWLGRMVQTFLSCVATGNVKVQWNVCRALGNLFMNETLELGNMNWAPSVFSILLLLLRDSPNYKIRIQTAAALAVPATIADYGESFSDIIKGVEHTVENLSSEQILPSSFKYKIALEKQLTSTLLHVLGLAASADHQPVKDFLVKKAAFLEEWFKALVSSLGGINTQVEAESHSSAEYQKKHIISVAMSSLIHIYKSRNLVATAEKFDKLMKSIG